MSSRIVLVLALLSFPAVPGSTTGWWRAVVPPVLQAQEQPPVAPSPPKKPATRRSAPRPVARPNLAIEVTDPQGKPIADVRIQMTGGLDRYGSTGADGTLRVTGLRAGPYRLRFEAEGFTPLERDLTLPVPNDRIDVTLTPAAAAPAPPPEPARAEPERPLGEARAVAVPSFVESNFIGRGQPQKLDVLGCTGYATTRILQVREPMTDRQHDDADETLYVVAGSVILRVAGNDRGLDAGGLAVLPRGTVHTLTRRGREVAVLVSVLSGPPCTNQPVK